MKAKNKKGSPKRTAARLVTELGDSPAFFGDLEMFYRTQRFLTREHSRLKARPATRRRQDQIDELKIRSRQLVIELTAWMERNA